MNNFLISEKIFNFQSTKTNKLFPVSDVAMITALCEVKQGPSQKAMSRFFHMFAKYITSCSIVSGFTELVSVFKPKYSEKRL